LYSGSPALELTSHGQHPPAPFSLPLPLPRPPAPNSHTNLLQIRRIGEVSLLFASSSSLALTAFISPYIADRELARALHAKHSPPLPFIEVFVDAPLDVVEQRDPKGLYKKARAGEIKEFTGISAPYEAPVSPEIHIRTDEVDVTGAVKVVLEYLVKEGIIKA
jgi:adenylylsulfate kinase